MAKRTSGDRLETCGRASAGSGDPRAAVVAQNGHDRALPTHRVGSTLPIWKARLSLANNAAKSIAAQSRITAQGQISVPADVRRKLGIGPGALLEWVEEEGKVVVRKVGKYRSSDIHEAVFGEEKPRKRSLTEMKAGIRQRMRKKYARD